MSNEHANHHLGLTAALFVLAAIPGAIALAGANAHVQDASILDGSYQRAYEDRFQRALPGRNLAVHVWSTIKYAALGEVSEGAVLGSDGWLFTAEEFEAPSHDRDLWVELDRARDALSDVGAILVPVIVPDKARIMASQLPLRRSQHFHARYYVILSGLAAAGYPAIDLRPVLDTGTDTRPGFMKTDTHWSPAGAAGVAATVASAINVDIASEANFVTQQVGTSEFDGDLLTFVDLGPFRDYFGPHPEIIDTYSTDLVDTASTGLFGDTEISVALVGTSYSARTDFHFEGFLKSQLGADIVNHADIGRGPFEPMEAFLAGLGETGSAPRIVIWEIPERYVATWGDT